MPAVQPPTSSSISATAARRASRVAKRGSSASSGLPSRPASAAQSASSRQVMATHSSSPAHRYMAPGRAPLGVDAAGAHRARLERLGGEQIGDHAGHRLDLGDLDQPTLDGASAPADQRGQRADGAQPPDEVVGEDRRRARRCLLALVAPEVGEAARGLGARPVAPPVGPQAPRAHQLARRHDDAGVHRGEVGVADAEVVHRPGGDVLDDDVGELGQLVEEGLALRRRGR